MEKKNTDNTNNHNKKFPWRRYDKYCYTRGTNIRCNIDTGASAHCTPPTQHPQPQQQSQQQQQEQQERK